MVGHDSDDGQAPKREVVHFYVDASSLYYGLAARGWSHLAWLDVQRLCESFVHPWQELRTVKYFTSRLNDSLRRERVQAQSDHLDALRKCCRKTMIFYGRFHGNPSLCAATGRSLHAPKEKRSDVNMAVSIIGDAMLGKADVFCVLTGDSDLVPVFNTVRALAGGRRIVAFFPPGRFSNHLKLVAHAHVMVGRSRIARCQLPDTVELRRGVAVSRPEIWTRRGTPA
ncbi:MAG: NYN domain-containing protein [Candidatus Sumerlaeia bacterium]|nr:NYN domain-containing protein [Candidatus Sumerlaeia bacterium]